MPVLPCVAIAPLLETACARGGPSAWSRRAGRPRWSRWSRLASALASISVAVTITGLLAGCGGGGSGSSNGGTNTPVTGSKSDAQFLAEYLSDWYLWYTRLPAPLDYTRYPSAQALLDAVRVKEDWYSYIDSAATFNAFFDEGQALGYGFGYSLVGNVMWIRYVQPLANAATAGLQRGDQVTAIGSQTIAQLLAGTGIDAALGPAVAGTQATLTVLRNGASITLPMTKSTYTVRSVIDERVLTTATGKVGYLVFTSFTNPAGPEWAAALDRVIAQGATDVIVDLRENGGGRLAVGATVASSLAPAGTTSRVEAALQYNDRHSGSNQTYYFNDTSASGKLQRLVWITSPRTCSASESVMVALRPVRSSWAVGETTCGKPVGFSPPEYNGKVYNMVTFKLANSAGFSDYYTGLTADCPIAEDFSKPFGDPLEPKLSAALKWLADGSCPSAAGSSKQALPPRLPPTGQGIELLTGLR